MCSDLQGTVAPGAALSQTVAETGDSVSHDMHTREDAGAGVPYMCVRSIQYLLTVMCTVSTRYVRLRGQTGPPRQGRDSPATTNDNTCTHTYKPN